MAHLHTPARRRNGTRPSCEPCRKSKYSCDHGLPQCARCLRRGILTKCVYHPAPMSGINYKKHHRSISQHEQARVHSPRRFPQSPETSASPSALNAQRMQPKGPGFLGSTSYRAALTEELDHTGLTNLLADCSAEHTEVAIQDQNSDSSAWRVNDAMSVFGCLKHFPVLETLASKWHLYYRSSSMIDFFTEDCVRSVKEDLLDNGSLATSPAMRITVEKIFRNTSRPVLVSKSLRMSDYVKLFTGATLRWEALAVFFLACGFCCHSVRSTDVSFVGSPTHGQLDRSALLKELLSASTTCVSLCEDLGNLSDLGLWSCHGVNILTSKVLGDSHPLVWRQGNDVSVHVVSRGLHSENERGLRQIPFWLIEMRRRALANIYATDKLLSTFFGRPPRLSQRYCTIHIPLDLELRELSLDDEDLREKMSSIGMDGWNQKHSERSGFLRCFILSSRLRENVLELSLGPRPDGLVEAAK